MRNKSKKLKIALVGLTSCEGCQFAILDLGNDLFDLMKKIDIVEFGLIEEEPDKSKYYDIVFVEGSPITQEHIELLKQIRKKAKKLVVLGNCAALGGVWEIKNYHNKQKTIKYIYKHHTTVPNPDIKEVDNFVDVDFIIPGCPINAEEFVKFLYAEIANIEFKIPELPVCYECQLNRNECLLQKGEICFGPVTLGGCDAVCLNSNQPCWGCRGLLKNANYKRLLKLLLEKHKQEEINFTLEVFGVRDDWEREINHESTKGAKNTKDIRNK